MTATVVTSSTSYDVEIRSATDIGNLFLSDRDIEKVYANGEIYAPYEVFEYFCLDGQWINSGRLHAIFR